MPIDVGMHEINAQHYQNSYPKKCTGSEKADHFWNAAWDPRRLGNRPGALPIKLL